MIFGNPIYAYSFYETYICFFLTFSPKAEGNICEIKQVDNSDKVVHIQLKNVNETLTSIKTYGPEKLLEDRIKRFWIGNYKYRCFLYPDSCKNTKFLKMTSFWVQKVTTI